MYIPLGGNRFSKWITLRNLFIVMFLGGLWHGAAWTFVVWGMLHGFYLVVYRQFVEQKSWFNKIPHILRVFVFFNLVCFAWVFFRASDFDTVWTYLHTMSKLSFTFSFAFGPIVLFLIALLLHYLFEPNLKRILKGFAGVHWSVHAICFYAVFAIVAILEERGVAQNVFIYFQF